MNAPIPEKISSELYSHFRQIQQSLADGEIPLLRDRQSLNSLPEQGLALYSDSPDEICLCTRFNGQMYKLPFQREE